MTQEVKVILTLEVDITQQSQDIKDFIDGLIEAHRLKSSKYKKMMYDFHTEVLIEEEREIYGN